MILLHIVQCLPIFIFLRRPGGAEGTLCHIRAHLCHQLLGWSCTHFILWLHLSCLFLYLIFYNWDLSKLRHTYQTFVTIIIKLGLTSKLVLHDNNGQTYLSQGPAYFCHHTLDVILGAAIFSQDPQRTPVDPEILKR